MTPRCFAFLFALAPLAAPGRLAAQDSGIRKFDISSGSAEDTLKEFSRESGRGVIAGNRNIAGIMTNAVQGNLAPKAALDEMLAGTGLTEAEDRETGAFAVRREEAGGGAPAHPRPTFSRPGPLRESMVTLDPFEVQVTKDKGYGAVNSNSLTAFKTELDKLPVSADVFDRTLLDDTGLGNVEQTLSFYLAGAGSFSNSPDTSASNSQYLDRNANGSLSIRGLAAPTIIINGFFPTAINGEGITGNGFTSDFDLEKVEVINGPQALLYGVSGAGGVINLTTKQARLATPAFGSAEFQTDQYGHKQGGLDYGAGTERVAVRVALVDQTVGGRRVFIGGPMTGQYVQFAVRPFDNTVIRAAIDNQIFNRVNSYSGTLPFTAASTSNDARNGQNLRWLLATDQLGSAANGGASGAGPIPGVTWDNVDSFNGDYSGEFRHHHEYLLTADTTWTPWLTSQLAMGYLSDTDYKIDNGSVTYVAANAPSNPTGVDAISLSQASDQILVEPTREKVARFSVLADNHFWEDAVHSESVVGLDFDRTDGPATISEYYVQADSNFNPVKTGSAANNGYTLMPTVFWGVPNGPVYQALFNPQNPRVTYNGVNYVRAITNASNPALISSSNPEGLTGTGLGNYRGGANLQNGGYAANYTDLFNGNLTLLLGARFGRLYNRSLSEEAPPAAPSRLNEVDDTYTAYNAGVNFKIAGPVRGYAEVSDDANPSAGQDTILGEQNEVTRGVGEEAGIKIATTKWDLSGSLAVFHAKSENETLSLTSTLFYDINPSGLNGVYNAGGSKVYVNRQTQGVQLTLTAAPGNWRLRFSAADVRATIANGETYNQVYNDQFNENAAGEVTYADGTVVDVPPTFNANGVIAAPAGSAPAGFVPLTVAQLNNPSSPYYANPLPVSSQINPSSSVAAVLRQVDPVHGAILTGATGLPISQLQIAPNSASPPPPGGIIVTAPGDAVTGFPRYSANFIGVYTIPTGFFKGVRMGGTASISWQTSMYYFYPQGVGVPNDRLMLYEPTEAVFTGILGYAHKFSRVTFSTQVNVNNLFNHYRVLYLPNSATGWAGPNDATLDQQPRYFVWSTTLSF